MVRAAGGRGALTKAAPNPAAGAQSLRGVYTARASACGTAAGTGEGTEVLRGTSRRRSVPRCGAVLGGASRSFGSQILVFHFPGMIERVKGGVPYQVPQRPLAGQFTL